MGDVATDIEALDDDAPPPPPKPDAGEPPDDTPPAAAPKPKAGKVEPPKPAAAPKPDKEPTGIVELRNIYREQKKQIAEKLQPEIQRLTAKVQELESRPAGPDKATQERVSQLEARNAELEQEMRFTNFAKSKEFDEKYRKPYVAAWQDMLRDIEELTVEVAGQDGQATTRQATEKDFLTLANLSLGEARRQANAMFGDSADDVMHHVRNIRELAKKQNAALEEARQSAETNAQTVAEQNKTAQATRLKWWNDANTELAERFPRWFKPADGDTEGNQLLTKGFALADLLFRGTALSEAEKAMLPAKFRADIEQHGKLSQENMVRFHALVRNKVANHDRLARQVNKLQKELADAKKALEEFEGSAPGTGLPARRRRAAAGGNGDTLDAALAELESLDK